jgi:hypothetical protein
MSFKALKSIAYAALLAAAGCATSSRTTYYGVVPVAPVQPSPWSPGQTVAYWVARSVVGPDGNVIHEAHPVYRRENYGQPQLTVPSAVWVPSAAAAVTTNSLIEQADLLRAETARTRDLSGQVARTGQNLLNQVRSLRAVTENAGQMQDQIRGVIQAGTSISNRVQLIEDRLARPSAAGGIPAGQTPDITNRYLSPANSNMPVKARP